MNLFLVLAELPFSVENTLPLIVETKNALEKSGKIFMLFLLLGILLWLFYSFKKAQKEKPKLGYQEKENLKIDIAKELKRIKGISEKSKNYKAALFEISEILRVYLKEKNNGKINTTSMTVEELAKVLENSGSIRILRELSDLQFDPENPEEEEFQQLLKRIISVSSEKYFAQVKKGILN